MHLAQHLQDPILIVEASFALSSLLYFAGEHVPAQKYLDQGMSNCTPEQHHPLIYYQDPGVALRSYSSHNLWLLGYPDRALQHGHEAIALAQKIDHPYSLAMALIWSCWTHIFRGETEKVLKRSQQAISLSAKHDFPVFEALGTIHNGWAMARDGQIEIGLAKMRKGLADSTLAMGADEPPATLSIHFASIYRDHQQPENSLPFLNTALQHGGENGLRLLEPELVRLKGKLLLLRDEPDDAVEAIFLQAVDLAREQQVRSLELRAVMSLARLWQSQGKTEAARQIVAEIYNWFTEGFDTLDLQEARKLLEDLS
jgi:predicted ATPase